VPCCLSAGRAAPAASPRHMHTPPPPPREHGCTQGGCRWWGGFRRRTVTWARRCAFLTVVALSTTSSRPLMSSTLPGRTPFTDVLYPAAHASAARPPAPAHASRERQNICARVQICARNAKTAAAAWGPPQLRKAAATPVGQGWVSVRARRQAWRVSATRGVCRSYCNDILWAMAAPASSYARTRTCTPTHADPPRGVL
jgi:hypothetical protein